MLHELAQFERLAASPARARALFDLWGRNDARADLPRLGRIRTLVLHDRDNLIVPTDHGRFLAERIPGASYHEYPGANELSTIESVREQTELISEWVTGSRARATPDRLVGALVFVDVVGSSNRVVRIGDLEWRAEVEAFRRAADGELARVGARLVNTRGDDVFAFCSTVGTAIGIARAIRTRAHDLGLETRAGIHLAEVDDVGDGGQGDAGGEELRMVRQEQQGREPAG
jgi:pimeloyl-ACP methyl ester carboxylesterase